MRYIEFIYLAAAVTLMALIATNHKSFDTFNYVAVILGIAIFSFMFSFRRKQRQALEAREREEIEHLEKEVEEDDER